MSFFLDEISRILARPMPRRRAIQLAGTAVAGVILGRSRLLAATAVTCTTKQTACGTPTNVCCTTASQKCCTTATNKGFCIPTSYTCCGATACPSSQICCTTASTPFCATAGNKCCGTTSCVPGAVCCSNVCCTKGEKCYKGRCTASTA